MKRARLILAVIALVALALLPASTAQATPTEQTSTRVECPNTSGFPWQWTSWGRARVKVLALDPGPDHAQGYFICGDTDDILTDGYCVHVIVYTPDSGHWNDVQGSESCGPITYFELSLFGSYFSSARLVRGPGFGVNYLTIWT